MVFNSLAKMLLMEQKCNLFDEEGISIKEAAVVKSHKFKFLPLFCQLTQFDIKGHNHQTHQILVLTCIFLTQRHVQVGIRILWSSRFLLGGARKQHLSRTVYNYFFCVYVMKLFQVYFCVI